MGKKIRSIIAAIVLAAICMSTPFGGSQETRAKGREYAEAYATIIYRPNEITEELAKRFEKSIRKEKSLGICTLDKGASIRKLQELVGKANGYGVMFRYKYDGKGGDGLYYYRITGLSCYSETLKLVKKIRNQYLIYYGGIKSRKKFTEPDDIETNDKYAFYRLVRDSQFCDLSSASKVQVISESAFWCDYKTTKKNPFIHFNEESFESGNTDRCNDSGKDSELIHLMLSGKAKAVENGYVAFERALYKHLGIKTYVASRKNKDICLINGENSNGKTLWMFQYLDELNDCTGTIHTLDKKDYGIQEFEMKEYGLLDFDAWDYIWNINEIV